MSDTFLHLQISHIRNETPHSKTFYFKTPDNAGFTYKAGQFLTFVFQHHKKEIRRSYSLGSSPGTDKEIFITIKKKMNGEISRLLFDHYKKYDLLIAVPPAGKFILNDSFAKKYFFISAGSGIIPVFSLIKELLFLHTETKIILLNQSRDETEVIYKNELTSLEKKFFDRFQIIQFFSRPKTNNYRPQHLNNDILMNILQEQNINLKPEDSAFYLCGPINFMRMAEFTLKLLGYNDSQIYKEQFVIPAPPPPPLMNDNAVKNVTIHFNKKVFQITTAYPKSILNAALEKNISLPFSCRAGICSSCMAKCLQGKVVMSENEVLTEPDIANGLILTCVGYAATDIELIFN